MKPLVIVGAGGFGREAACIAAAINAVEPTWDVLGVLDDSPSMFNNAAVVALGLTVIGRLTDLSTIDAHAILAIGSPSIRARVAEQYTSTPWAVLVHPDATVGPEVDLGVGTVVAAGARLSTAIHGGAHLHVDQNVTVGHDSVLGDCVRLNPQACVSGSVTLGDRTLIGASAVVLEGLTVGRDAVVGAGAVVTRNVPDAAIVKGVPAR